MSMRAVAQRGPAARVLIVEDDSAVAEGVTLALIMSGFEVSRLANGAGDFAGAIEAFRPDLVLIDVFLPFGPDGFALATTVKAAGVPIVFLTAADTLEQRLAGFEAGADDYVVKPFATAELLARVRAVLRRAGRLTSPTLEVRDLLIDEANQKVVRAGHVVELTPTEFELLRTLAQTPGRVFSKAQLLSQVWGFDRYDPNLVEVFISAVRHKLEVFGPRLIFTERGAGYVIRP